MKTVSFLLLLLSLEGCTKFSDDIPLLQIGEYKLTVSEFEGLRKDFRYRNIANDSELEAKVIEDGYVSAYAIANRFDTIGQLKKKLDYAIRFYTSSVDGYVWNKKVKPLLSINETDVKNAYNKRSVEYSLDLIHIPDKELLKKYFPSNYQVRSSADFEFIKSKIVTEPNIRCFSSVQKYPFFPLGINIARVETAKAGDAWGPFEAMDGYYVVNLNSITQVGLASFDVEKKQIEQSLLRQLTNQFIWDSQKEILQKTSPVMNEPAIRAMISKCDIKNRKCAGMDPNAVLMEYRFQGKKQIYTVADLIDFVNYEPVIVGSLSDVGSVKNMLINNLMDMYLYAEALKMNMLTDKEYLIFKKNRQQKIFSEYFRERNNDSKLPIDEGEMKQYYRLNPDKFRGIKSATVSIYKFKNAQAASDGILPIMAKYNNTTPGGLVAECKKIEIPVSYDTQLNFIDNSCPSAVAGEIAHLKVGQVSMPVSVNDEYWVIYVAGKSDPVLLPYDCVKGQIRDLWPTIKKNESFNKQLSILKSKYPLKINRIKEYLQSMGNVSHSDSKI